MRAHKQWAWRLLILGLVGGLLPGGGVRAENLRFYGALVAEPCTLAPGDARISLDFGAVVEKYLYLNGRTPGKTFQLHLTGCEVAAGSGVTVTFTGTENTALPGLLALERASEAGGIAIGMETPAGKPLPFNQRSALYPLTPGDNVLTLQAYVQGEPEAIRQQAIKRGAFSAVATFRLAYP